MLKNEKGMFLNNIILNVHLAFRELYLCEVHEVHSTDNLF